MTERTAPGTRDMNAAALHILADGVKLEQLPIPHSVDMWAHELPKTQFTMWADRFAARIDVREINNPHNASDRAYATFNCTVNADSLPDTARITLYVTCEDVSASARMEYATHNQDCVLPIDPCADGRCVDPAAHAEGAHDL